jgi:hypothetical protein
MHRVRDVIPAPEPDHPTARHGGQDAPARFRDQPQDERIVKPPLRQKAGEEKQQGVAVAPPPKRQGQQRPRHNQQWHKMLITVELRNPFQRPMGSEDKTRKQQKGRRPPSGARKVSECDRRTDLGLGEAECKCQREESRAHDERRPLHRHERGPVRIGKKDQQPFRPLPNESESEQSGAGPEKEGSGNFGRERGERQCRKSRGQRVGNDSRRSAGVGILARQESARGVMGPVEIRTAKLEVVQERPAQRAAHNTDGGRSGEISARTRNAHGSVVISRFSQIRMRPAISYKPLWLVLAAALCAVGMWTYANRVLIPYQKADANAHQRPRGNLSDLYPRWVGARELLLHGRDPYSAEVTREIQVGFYGRPLDPSLPGEPRDEEGFAYPVYVVFCLAPTIGMPFAIVQKGFYWGLLLLTCATTLLWLRVLRRSVPLWIQISLVALTLGSPAVMQELKLRQMSLLVAGLIAIAITLLVMDYPVAAGFLLALASIKPQLVVLLLCCLAIWTLADWRRRYRLAVSFLATMTILVAASEWYLPHWIPRFWRAIREYQHYTGATSVIDNLVGTPWSWAVELLVSPAGAV